MVHGMCRHALLPSLWGCMIYVFVRHTRLSNDASHGTGSSPECADPDVFELLNNGVVAIGALRIADARGPSAVSLYGTLKRVERLSLDV